MDKLEEAVKLLEYGLHLRMNGENAPGGSETWNEWDTRTEEFLRRIKLYQPKNEISDRFYPR
jgi:hypothetical protein